MKFVQVIPIPVTYSRNLESFFVERSRIVDLLLFSLSLSSWGGVEQLKRGSQVYPAARYFREFILVAVFSRLDDHHPSYLDPRGKSAKPRKMPTPRKYWPPSPSLFMPKTVGNTAPFLPLGGEEEQSWKNRGKIRFGTNEFLVERYSRHLVLLWPRDVVTLWYKRRARVISRAKLLRPRWCIGLTTSEDSARA